MLRATIFYVIAASLVVLFSNEALARGRSFPIEITGTIVSFDRANQTFTIRVDEPARVLKIGVRRDCKFKQNNSPTTERIMKAGARVKVSYFATIFTGNLAVEIEVNPAPEFTTGTIESIDIPDRRLVLGLGPNLHHLVLRWATNARFIKTGKPSSAAALRVRSTARVAYYAPSFASMYAVRIDFQ